jgi:hypothetical protein
MLTLQTSTPDTTGYMILGYVVILGVMLLYLGSMLLRNRSLKQDLEMLNELDQQEEKK